MIEPKVRFIGQPGGRSTLFLRDSSGNGLEFKAFGDDGQILART